MKKLNAKVQRQKEKAKKSYRKITSVAGMSGSSPTANRQQLHKLMQHWRTQQAVSLQDSRGLTS